MGKGKKTRCIYYGKVSCSMKRVAIMGLTNETNDEKGHGKQA
jgi:hypothetical protein